MNTAPIIAAPGEMTGLAPPQPSAPATQSFSDMLKSATSSLAAFAMLPTTGSDTFGGSSDATPPARSKDPNSDNAVAPIALPAPVQAPPAVSSSGGSVDSNTSQSPSASNAGAQPQTQSSQATTAANGAAGTGGTSNGSAQTASGVALPPMAAELGTRIALGAQALLSQPSQVLATLPHGALQAASTPALTPNVGTAAHGAAAPDPTAVLPKLAATATLTAATPNTATTTLEAALQSSAAQTSATQTATAGDPAILAKTSDTAQSTDLAFGATPAAVPLAATEAAFTIETAPPPAIAASALDQVAASLTQGTKLGLSQIEIQLRPASLGAVDVKIELTHDGRVTAVISADRSDTLLQLERGSGELQQALKDAGLQTDSGSLSFNLRGDPQTSDQSSRQPSYAPQPAIPGSGDDLLALPAAIAGGSQSAHNGLLNIQV
jgi:flagellar hook-length control protein FliK